MLKNFHESIDEDPLFFSGVEVAQNAIISPQHPPFAYTSDSVNKADVYDSGSSFPPHEEREGEGNASPPPSVIPSPSPPPVEDEEATAQTADDTDMGADHTPERETDTPPPTRRTTRDNVFRGHFHDGYSRRGKRKTRYP